jgi:hypothetical protein
VFHEGEDRSSPPLNDGKTDEELLEEAVHQPSSFEIPNEEEDDDVKVEETTFEDLDRQESTAPLLEEDARIEAADAP